MDKIATGIMAAVGLVAATLAGPAAADNKAHADYILHCSGCHGTSGKGTVAGGIPAFPNSIEHLASYENGRNYIFQVPGVITTDMTPAEMAGVMNYILKEWSSESDFVPFSAEEVAERRALPEREVVTYRREVVEELLARGIEIAEYPWP